MKEKLSKIDLSIVSEKGLIYKILKESEETNSKELTEKDIDLINPFKEEKKKESLKAIIKKSFAGYTVDALDASAK
jgi:hypothetical protein